MKKLALLCTAVAALSAAIATPVMVEADLTAAQKNYQTFCVKCHGDTGKGDGSGAATLTTKPYNFTDCAATQKLSDATLFNVIKNGGKANGLSPDMIAWGGGFDDSEIRDLVAYLRTFCKK